MTSETGHAIGMPKSGHAIEYFVGNVFCGNVPLMSNLAFFKERLSAKVGLSLGLSAKVEWAVIKYRFKREGRIASL